MIREIDSFDSPSEENFSLKLSMPGVVSFLFRLINDFPDLNKSIDWLSLVEESFSLPFKGAVYTRTVPATLVLLRSKLPNLLPLF